MADPEEVLAWLAADLVQTLGDQLVSLAVHGSWALGDFIPGRSDLDVLAVMAADPTAATLAELHQVHARLATTFPEWGDGQVEVEYVSVEAIRAVVQGSDAPHPMISVGKGEPLHELEASRHSVLNWAAALDADRPIAGAAPSAVLPAIDQRLIHQVVLQHVRAWPEWVDEMRHAGGQAYAVLTLCRAAEVLATRRQVSKLAAARAGILRFPEWASLIDWARAWWYEGGSDLDHGRFEDVRRFVLDVSARTPAHDVAPDPAECFGQVLSYADARRLARDHQWREKTLVYVTRGEELLVLEHGSDFPDAGIQVPAGGVDPGESPEAAAIRELFEETGLRPEVPPVYLQSCWWPDPDAPSRIRHSYWVQVAAGTPTAWSHVVSAGEEDQGITFRLSFRPLSKPDLTPGYGWEEALPCLASTMKQR